MRRLPALEHGAPTCLASPPWSRRYRWGQSYGRTEDTTNPDQAQHLADRLLSLAASCAGLAAPVGPRCVATCGDAILDGYAGTTPEALALREQDAAVCESFGPGQMDPPADSFCR